MNEGLKRYLLASEPQMVLDAYMTGNVSDIDAIDVLSTKLPKPTAERLVVNASRRRSEGWTDIVINHPVNINYTIFDRGSLLAIGTLEQVLSSVVEVLGLNERFPYKHEPGYIKRLIDNIRRSDRFSLERAKF